ncbi:GntR family transcriptional regulator [Acrocarpospora phusangensis]|uniref:GntR family transcriptional regulator n=1 Tax=Acrocarpospora phusangensis TaxID=1070424 RepID=UPI001EF16580|nr:GntR family transcriptional regulator [Acrocarpospora phusangensis]
MIVWKPNLPKSDQIANIIRERIADGTYRPDEAVPSQFQLVEEFGVARGTARKAVVKLMESGDVYTVRGLGTFVSPPKQPSS